MSHLPTIFENYAKEILTSFLEIISEWEACSSDKRRLTIGKQDRSGFNIIIECETWGLYPFADESHGSPWEHLDEESDLDLCEQFMGFIRTLLSEDSKLEVHYSGANPYKWVLFYETERGREFEETGLLLFNYFGKKHTKVFQNKFLPRRYGQ